MIIVKKIKINEIKKSTQGHNTELAITAYLNIC